MKRAPFTAVVLLTLTSPCLAQDKSTIHAISEQFSKSLLAADGKAVSELYADDAILVPPAEPIVTGKAAIQNYWTKSGSGLSEFNLTTLDVQSLGADYAREIGTYSGKTKDAPIQSFSGKDVVIYKKSGNKWLITTDTWNADK